MRCLRALAAAALALGALPAAGAGVRLAPVTLVMAPERPIASFKLTNERLEEAAFEALVFAWSQGPGGETILLPTDDLRVAPSTFIVAPGAAQTVRIGASAAMTSTAEQSYRLILRELPLKPAGEAVRLRIEMSAPVFVRPRGAVPRLAVHRAADGDIRIRNIGAAHVRLYPSADAPEPPRYLLPGAEIGGPATPRSSIVLRFAGPDGALVEERTFMTADAGASVVPR